MAKKVRSARGVLVDFDLLKVKQQIAESPAVDVTAREDFVERRLRRRTRRTATPVKPIVAEPTESLDDVDEDVVEDGEVTEMSNSTETENQPRTIRKRQTKQ